MKTTKWTMKVGEIFTVERAVCAGSGMNAVLTRLEGGVILIDTYVRPEAPALEGAPGKRAFVFKCVQAGDAAIQFGRLFASDPEHVLYEEVLPIEVGDASDAVNGFGGWTPVRDLTEEDRLVFEEAMKGIFGVTYTPLKVSSQLVAGMNYCFRCEATMVTQSPETYLVQINIFSPLPGQGAPYVTSIVRLLGDD